MSNRPLKLAVKLFYTSYLHPSGCIRYSGRNRCIFSMNRSRRRASPKAKSWALPKLLKVPTGITGFDDVTEGGVPAGRPTLVCGLAGGGQARFARGML